jgi:hypothetical protein
MQIRILLIIKVSATGSEDPTFHFDADPHPA